MQPILHLKPIHLEPIKTHLLALDSESRRLRFGIEMRDETIINYIDKIRWNEDGLYGIFNFEMLLVGFAHAARCNDMIEFGVSVLPKYRGRGYGTALFIKAVLFARNHYINKIFMHCLLKNAPMLKIARRKGMRLVVESGEVDAYLELPPLDQASIAEDMVQEELGTFDTVLKRSVHNFDMYTKGFTSLYSTYVNSFITKSLKDSANVSVTANKPIPKSKKAKKKQTL